MMKKKKDCLICDLNYFPIGKKNKKNSRLEITRPKDEYFL